MIRTVVKAVGLIAFGLLLALGLFELVLRPAGIGGPADLDPTYDRPEQAYVPMTPLEPLWSRDTQPELQGRDVFSPEGPLFRRNAPPLNY